MVYAPADGASAERSGDRVVVLDPAGEVLSTLSPVGAVVWESLPAAVDTLVEHLRAEFPEVDPEVLARDTQQFLDELCSAGLAVHDDASG